VRNTAGKKPGDPGGFAIENDHIEFRFPVEIKNFAGNILFPGSKNGVNLRVC
jgi:hypothetical protein